MLFLFVGSLFCKSSLIVLPFWLFFVSVAAPCTFLPTLLCFAIFFHVTVLFETLLWCVYPSVSWCTGWLPGQWRLSSWSFTRYIHWLSYKLRSPGIWKLQVDFCAAYFLQFSFPLFSLKVEGILRATTLLLLWGFFPSFSFVLLAIHFLAIYYIMPKLTILALLGVKLFLILSQDF